jgi:hypothetical protein
MSTPDLDCAKADSIAKARDRLNPAVVQRRLRSGIAKTPLKHNKSSERGF